MSFTQFKLTKSGGLTRRIQFPGTEPPSWFTLASKIESLYDIPIEKIGVAYIDNDGDEVTLSSEDELQDFYAAAHKPSDTVKLVVQDLGSLRDSQHLSSSKPGSITPQNTNYRNTFGGPDAVPMSYEVEDDWQRLPHGLGELFGRHNISDSDGFFGAPDSPHAFIEVLDSDANSIVKDAENAADTTMESDLLSSLGTPIAKGKGKSLAEMQPSVSDDVSSTGSVLVEETPVKLPIHVLNVANEGMLEPVLVDVSPSHPGIDSPGKTSTSIQIESTPVAVPPNLPAEKGKVETTTRAIPAEEEAADPPLPTVDSAQTTTHSVSLTSDVAAFLTSLSRVFSSHPELSEGLRNITRNTTNGTYWSAHRDAVSRAAEELRRSATEQSGRAAGELRVAEEEAGRRVAEALGGFMRLFGDMAAGVRGNEGRGTPNGGPDASTQPTTVDYGDMNSTNFVPPPWAGDGTPPLGRPFSWGASERFPPPPGAPPPPGWPRRAPWRPASWWGSALRRPGSPRRR